jgi:hypothetical protein
VPVLSVAIVALCLMWPPAVIPLMAMVPSMIMSDVAVSAFPASGEILSVEVVGRYPIRAGVGRTRPVAIVPKVVSSLRILISLDPAVVRSRLRRDVIRTWRWRRPDMDVKGDLRSSGSGSSEQ